MIGLCRGLAFRAYTETRPDELEVWYPWLSAETFGLIECRDSVTSNVADVRETFPTSFRYFELLDACPLRMSGEQP